MLSRLSFKKHSMHLKVDTFPSDHEISAKNFGKLSNVGVKGYVLKKSLSKFPRVYLINVKATQRVCQKFAFSLKKTLQFENSILDLKHKSQKEFNKKLF